MSDGEPASSHAHLPDRFLHLLFILLASCGELDDSPNCYEGTCFVVDPSTGQAAIESIRSHPEYLRNPAPLGASANNDTAFVFPEGQLAVAYASEAARDGLLRKYHARLSTVPVPRGFSQVQVQADGTSVPSSLATLIELSPSSFPLDRLAPLLHRAGLTGTIRFRTVMSAVTAGVHLQIAEEDSRKATVRMISFGVSPEEALVDGGTRRASMSLRTPPECGPFDIVFGEHDDLMPPIRPYLPGDRFHGRCPCVSESPEGIITYDPRTSQGFLANSCRIGLHDMAAPALIATHADLFDVREDNCEETTLSFVKANGGHVGNLHMWVLPDSVFPITVHLEAFDDTTPPGALDTFLPGATYNGDDSNPGNCEFLAYRPVDLQSTPLRMNYTHFPLWEWAAGDNRVQIFVWEGDECKCIPFVCLFTGRVCNFDDPLAWFTIDRSDPRLRAGRTLSDADTYDAPWLPAERNHDIDLTLQSIDECDARTGGRSDREVCDGHDNDCNGTADESVRNACNACGPTPVEVCDGIDNDCDGRIDEDVHNACGACGAVPPEVCNGRDDNCDGRIDEEFPEDGQSCGRQTGQCTPGTLTCSGGTLVCTGALGPVAEVCGDMVDNDCDGSTDEDFVCCGTVPCGTSVGACRPGRYVCTSGGWSECGGDGYVPPTPEVCDGVDNDCNRTVDDGAGCACPTGASRSCGVNAGACRPGIQLCERGEWTGCQGAIGPSDEACNGLDDDCDGLIDEDILSRSCWTRCARGEQRCAGGRWTTCSARQPAVSERTCDGLDDDCDGQTDEDDSAADGRPLRESCYEGPPSTRTVGLCRDGLRFCSGGSFIGQPCVGQTLPAGIDPCDGQDNNCNGTPDEGFNLANDTSNCGRCGRVCSPSGTISNLCSGGVCSPVCTPTTYDLDGDGSNGCEATCPATAPAGVLADGGPWPDAYPRSVTVGENVITLWGGNPRDCSGGPYVFGVVYRSDGTVVVPAARLPAPTFDPGNPGQFAAFPHPGGFIYFESQTSASCGSGRYQVLVHRYDGMLRFLGTTSFDDCSAGFNGNVAASWMGDRFFVVSGATAFFLDSNGRRLTSYMRISGASPRRFINRLGGFSGTHHYFLAVQPDVRVVRFTADGVLDGEFPVSGNLNTTNADIPSLDFAWLGSAYAVFGSYVISSGRYHSDLLLFSPEGDSLRTYTLNPASDVGTFLPQVTSNGRMSGLVWSEEDSVLREITVRFSTIDARVRDLPRGTLIANHPAMRATVAPLPDGFAIPYFVSDGHFCSCCSIRNDLRMISLRCR